MNRTDHPNPRRRVPPRLTLLLLAAALLGGCATTGNSELTDPVNDPWEPFNRKVYAFNDAVDEAILEPVARGYRKVTPDPIERGVHNFVTNLKYPVTIVNLALQGKFKETLAGTGRFLANSIFGLGGLIDVASKEGIPNYNEDFGQTLAVWGYEDSRYLVLPLLGPSTVRDGISRPVDALTNPISYLAGEEDIYTPLVLDIVDTRARLLEQTDELETAYDPYLLMRDAYLQNREFRIYDGEPPLPDYEDFLEQE